MNVAALPTPAGSLFGRGLLAASLGAIALVSLMAFEAMALAAAMPAIAAALDGLRWYALAFGGMLATSVFGMVLAGRSCDRDGPLRAAARRRVLSCPRPARRAVFVPGAAAYGFGCASAHAFTAASVFSTCLSGDRLVYS